MTGELARLWNEGLGPFSEQRDEKFRKLFIGGLSFSTDETSLAKFFSQWGEIVDCVVMRTNDKKRSRGFGFVTYRDPQNVDIAQSHRPHEIDGKVVESKRAMPREDSKSPGAHLTVHKIYISNVPATFNREILCNYFSKYGTINNCEISQDQKESWAYITFEDYDSTDKAMLYKPHIVSGYDLNVRKALTKQQMNLVKAKLQSLHLENFIVAHNVNLNGAYCV